MNKIRSIRVIATSFSLSLASPSAFVVVSLMKFDFELQAVLKRQTIVEIHHVWQQVAPFGQFHPRLPLGVTGSFQRVMTVASACPHLNASPGESLPGGQTNMSFFRAFRLVGLVFRYQPAQRTVEAAVRLFWWQLYWCLVLRFSHKLKIYFDFRHDSAKLMRASFCSRCSESSHNAQKYFYKW